MFFRWCALLLASCPQRQRNVCHQAEAYDQHDQAENIEGHVIL